MCVCVMWNNAAYHQTLTVTTTTLEMWMRSKSCPFFTFFVHFAALGLSCVAADGGKKTVVACFAVIFAIIIIIINHYPIVIM